MGAGAGAKRPIIVGVDGSRESTAVLAWAAKEAFVRRGRLRLVHAFDASRRTGTGQPGVTTPSTSRSGRSPRTAASAASTPPEPRTSAWALLHHVSVEAREQISPPRPHRDCSGGHATASSSGSSAYASADRTSVVWDSAIVRPARPSAIGCYGLPVGAGTDFTTEGAHLRRR